MYWLTSSALSFFLGWVLTSAFIREAGATAREELQATFVYKFLSFVSFRTPPTTLLRLCVVGEQIDVEPLKRYSSRKVGELSVEVSELQTPDEARSCHVVYFAKESRDIIRAVIGNGALTIGIGSRFLDQGGVIALEEEDEKIRFQVSTQAAEKEGLTLDSRLLQLAKIRR